MSPISDFQNIGKDLLIDNTITRQTFDENELYL